MKYVFDTSVLIDHLRGSEKQSPSRTKKREIEGVIFGHHKAELIS
jgi:predicted nucleic acid-binding protein